MRNSVRRVSVVVALIVCIAVILVLMGCAKNWKYMALDELVVEPAPPGPEACGKCHGRQYKSWAANPHGDGGRMEKITVGALRGCGACHSGLEAHVKEPDASRPADISALSKTEQNSLCGRCHYNKDVFGGKAIFPHGRHGVLMSVGYTEASKRQISCLGCHEGHGERAGMLQGIRAHVCFRCHKEAIVTMGVFQPFNYIGFGKVCLTCHSEHGSTTARQAARVTVGTAALCVVCHI